MRNKIATILIIASSVLWGLYCGGQLFNELMTVPIWSADPPASLKAYAAMPSRGGFNFFILFNPLFALIAIVALIVAWPSARGAKLWLGLSAATTVAVSLVLIFYLAPLVMSLFVHSTAADVPASEIVAGVERWKLGNRIRLAVEILGFVFSLIAISKWPRDSTLDGPTVPMR